MDNGELDFSNQEVLSRTNMDEIGIPSSVSMDSLFEQLMTDDHHCHQNHNHHNDDNVDHGDQTQTNCFHAHTRIISPQTTTTTTTTTTTAEDKATVSTDDSIESTDKKSKKNPMGNREAVRKYRERKKQRAASMEAEVVRLRSVNQQLMKRVQNQAAMVNEIARLKYLLVDIRGRIGGEISSFPYNQKAGANSNNAGLNSNLKNMGGGSGGAGGGCLMNHQQFHCVARPRKRYEHKK